MTVKCFPSRAFSFMKTAAEGKVYYSDFGKTVILQIISFHEIKCLKITKMQQEIKKSKELCEQAKLTKCL